MCYFSGMKLTLIFCTAIAAVTLTTIAADPAAPDSGAKSDKSQSTTSDTKPPEPPGKEFTNSVDMVLLQVPGGFWAGKYEVTQKEYTKVMGSNPSAFPGDTHPVDSISYSDAIEFCKKMTEMDITKKFLPEGYHYTLPTEDEWQSLVAGATADSAVTSLNATRTSTSPVGSLAANELGLYDVLGNVTEFCLTDESKPYRLLHGGSWQDFVEVNLRPEFRWYAKPEDKLNTFGFRVLIKKGGA